MRHISDLLAEHIERQAPDTDAFEQDFAPGRVVQPRHEAGKRGLAAADRADNRQRLAFLHGKAHVADSLAAGVRVLDADVPPLDHPADVIIGSQRIGRVGDPRAIVQQFVESPQRGDAALGDVDHHAHADHGPRQHCHEIDEHREGADGHRALQHPPATESEQADAGQSDQELQQGIEAAPDADQPEAGLDIVGIGSGEPADLGRALVVGPQHAQAGQVLLHPDADPGEVLLDGLELLVRAAAEVSYRQRDQRHGREDDQSEQPVRPSHDGEHRRDHNPDLGRVHQPRPQQGAHLGEVVGHPRHQVAGAVALVKRPIQRDQVGADVVAQVVLDIARDRDQNPAHRILRDSLAGGDAEHQQHGIHGSLLLARGQLVHRPPDQQRHSGRQHAAKQQRGQASRVAPAIAEQVRKQRAQRCQQGRPTSGRASSR